VFAIFLQVQKETRREARSLYPDSKGEISGG